jgi:hypothetical protein
MVDMFQISEENFLLYSARNYNNPQCYDVMEFEEDLKRFKYLKRLFNKYIEYGELKERLILNHIISLNNVFGPTATTKMLFFKLIGYESYFTPFLNLLGMMPNVVYGIGVNNETIYSNDIHIDRFIENKLKEI